MFRYAVIFLASLFTFVSFYIITSSPERADFSNAKSFSDFVIITGWFAIGSFAGCLMTAVGEAKPGNSISFCGTDIFLPKTLYDYIRIYFKTIMSGMLLFLCLFILVGVFLVLARGFRFNLGGRE